MTIAFDTASASGQTTTGNMSYTHTPVGTPRGVIVNIVQNVGTGDEVTSCSYGGVAMTRVAMNSHSTGEPGVVYIYFLGASIPTGAQSVTTVVTGGGSNKNSKAVTYTASTDTEIVSYDTSINSDAQVDPSCTVALNGRTSAVLIAFHSGQDGVSGIAPLTGWTSRDEVDFGFQSTGFYTYDTISNVNVTAGWTQTSNDACAVAVAVSELAASGANHLMMLGVG